MGAKEPCSTSLILYLQFLFFSFSWWVKQDKGELLVRLGERVENLNIKKCILSIAPEVPGYDVNSGFILSVGGGVVEGFTGQWLKYRF
jgi:hypothetical protein